MKKGTKEAGQLIDKYLADQCTPEEIAIVETWFNKQSTQVVTEIPEKPRYAKFPKTWVTIAASLTVICTVAYFLADFRNEPPATITDTVEIKPQGIGTATLAFADGSTVSLDSSQAGIIVSGDILRYSDGSNLQFSSTLRTTSQTDKLVLATPRGGQYQITLSDGTSVWLNTASSLKYPMQFTGDNRIVELDGEAYFEVSPSSQPFIVRTNTQETVVLGTTFNITAYGDDPVVRTTLLTGALEVRRAGQNGHDKVRLAPHEASINTGTTIMKARADVTGAVAWKNGRFSFEGKSFKEIMAEMIRWYDLEVTYEGSIPNEQFIGGAYRDQDLRILHSFLESAGMSYHMITSKNIVIRHQ